MKKSHPQPTTTKRRPTGFTLIELIFAMTMFTFFLVISFRTIVNIIKIYETARTSRNNQQVARTILEEITHQDGFSNGISVTAAFGNIPTICIAQSGGTITSIGDPTAPVNNNVDVFFVAAPRATPVAPFTAPADPYHQVLYEASGINTATGTGSISCQDTPILEQSLNNAPSVRALTNATINQNSTTTTGSNMLYWQPDVVTTSHTDPVGNVHTTQTLELTMTVSQPGTPLANSGGVLINDVYSSAITIHTAISRGNAVTN